MTGATPGTGVPADASPDQVRHPATVQEARRDLEQLGPDAVLVAGATALLGFSSREWVRRPTEVVSLRAVGGHYRQLAELDGGCRIGAGVLLARLAGDRGSAGERAAVPSLLREAASTVAFPGIRLLATVGGNLVNGRMASQLLPALAVLRARLMLQTRSGAEVHDLDVPGYRRSPSFDSDPRAVIEAVQVLAPPLGARQGWVASARDRARMFAAAVRDARGDIRLSALGPGGWWVWHLPVGRGFGYDDAQGLADGCWRDTATVPDGRPTGDQLRWRGLLRKVLRQVADDGGGERAEVAR